MLHSQVSLCVAVVTNSSELVKIAKGTTRWQKSSFYSFCCVLLSFFFPAFSSIVNICCFLFFSVCYLVRYILTWIYVSECAFAPLKKEVVNHPKSYEMFVFSVLRCNFQTSFSVINMFLILLKLL